MVSFYILPAQDELKVLQDDVEEVQSQLTALNQNFEKLTNKNIQFGLSIGYRFLTGDSKEKISTSHHFANRFYPTIVSYRRWRVRLVYIGNFQS